ncbi:MAG: hypothetical protein ABWY06_08935 [Pseudomonas sp.]|uniref:hypothetical protein n=1 Tax=Pseudomonas sp. TaxID=306 RepID=UPI00339B9322
MESHPYVAPRGNLVDPPEIPPLARWSARRLFLLTALSLLSVLGTLVSFLVSLSLDERLLVLQPYLDALGMTLVLLGAFLLVRVKDFARDRFAARHLAVPVWCAVLASVLMGAISFSIGQEALSHLGWQSVFYLALLVLTGAVTLWLGLCLRKVRQAYRAFRIMAWLDIVGGACMASILLLVAAVLPLFGASVAMMWVFLQGALEQRALRHSPGSGRSV